MISWCCVIGRDLSPRATKFNSRAARRLIHQCLLTLNQYVGRCRNFSSKWGFPPASLHPFLVPKTCAQVQADIIYKASGILKDRSILPLSCLGSYNQRHARLCGWTFFVQVGEFDNDTDIHAVILLFITETVTIGLDLNQRSLH